MVDEATDRERIITTLERQAELLELAHDAILVRDLDGTIRFWNHGAETLYGWHRDRVIGRRSHDLLQTVFPVPFQDIEKALKKTGRWEGELRHTVREGGTVVVSSRWVVRDAGDGIEILEINRDITAQKRVEEGFRGINRELEMRVEELGRAQEGFRDLVESAPDATVIFNSQGTIVLVNKQTETLFGYMRDELVGKSVDLLVPERLRTRHMAHPFGYARKPHVRRMSEGLKLFGLRKNGEEFPAEITLNPVRTATDIFISTSIRDISERKKSEMALREKGVQLEQADKARDLFLASMSRELRAPLHTIIGCADLLAEQRKGPLNEDQMRYVDNIIGDSRHLMAVINDLLGLS